MGSKSSMTSRSMYNSSAQEKKSYVEQISNSCPKPVSTLSHDIPVRTVKIASFRDYSTGKGV